MRTGTALVAAILAAGLLASPAAPALTRAAAAQEKEKEKDKKDKEKEEEKKRKEEKKRRDKALKEIGDNFGSKDTSWLLNRVPDEQKLTLCLASDKGDVDYSLDQARGVLDRFFDDLQTLSVETTSKDATLTEKAGSFPMTFRRKAEKRDKSATLYVTISGLDSTSNGQLTKLSVELQ